MSENGKYYRFGGFRFDGRSLSLEFGGEPVNLPPKSLEVLNLLLERPGEIVDRETLMQTLWNESFVEEANLTVTVSRLRKALADHSPDETFIQTVPRVGYRFIADVEKPSLADPQDLKTDSVNRTAPRPSVAGLSRRYLFLAVIAFISVGLLSIAWAFKENTAEPPKLSDAEQAFAKGDSILRKRQPCDSIPYFQEAIDRDPAYAVAFARLAVAQAMCPIPGDARVNLAKALELDPDLADAHAVDGFIRMAYDWDWPGAERSLRRAIELDPGSAMAHHWLAVYLSIHDRTAEAKGEMQRAIDIEPDSPLYRADQCQLLYFRRQYSSAEMECRKSIELDPTFLFPYNYLQDIYLQSGNEEAAIQITLARFEIDGTGSEVIQQLREIFARGGFREFKQYQLDQSLAAWEAYSAFPDQQRPRLFGIASLYVALGDRENAIRWLDDAVSTEGVIRPFLLLYLGVDPKYDYLRKDPRFRKILEKMGLPTGGLP